MITLGKISLISHNEQPSHRNISDEAVTFLVITTANQLAKVDCRFFVSAAPTSDNRKDYQS